MNNTVNIIGRIDQKIAATIGTNKFTEQLTQNLDKYAGINVDDKQPHEICKLRFVLADNITIKTNCKESMNLYSTNVKQTMNLVKDLTPENIATELPNMLKGLDAKMKLQGQYFIVAHLPYDESKNIKAGGRMMWIKFLDTEDKPELFTIYNNVQSQNHKITLGQSEKYSLKEDGEYISEKSEKAATKIQAMTRGKKGRQDAKTVRTEKEAATKIQALGRGKIVRQKAKEQRERAEEAAQQRDEIIEANKVKKLTTKTNTLQTLQFLKDKKLPPRGIVRRGLHLDQDKHNQDKQNLIKEVNTEIINYNKEFPDSQIEIIEYNDINEIERATIIDQISYKINEIKGNKKGGKSTRRRRRKVIPTRKRDHKKPKTKKKSNKGVVKKRKTRSKK